MAIGISTLAALIAGSIQTSAYELYSDEDTHLSANLEATCGVFNSQQNYSNSGSKSKGSSTRREGYIKYGISGDQGLAGALANGSRHWVKTAQTCPSAARGLRSAMVF